MNLTTKEFISRINKLRKTDKESFYAYQGTVEGKQVILKGYKLWLQVYKVGSTDYSSTMGITTVKDFNKALSEPFNKK